MNKYIEPWIEVDKRRSTHRVRWWKKVNGSWVKDKGISCGTAKSYAKDMCRKVRERLEKESLGEVDLSRTITECFDAFMRDRELNGYPAATLRTYRQAMDDFLKRGAVTLQDCSPQALKGYRNWMLTPGSNTLFSTKEKPVAMKPNTIRRRLMDLRTWLSWATADGWFKINPWSEVVKPNGGKRTTFLPKHKSVARFYTDEEIVNIEAAIGQAFWKNDPEKAATEKQDAHEFLCAWRMVSEAGLREGEAFKARMEDVKVLEHGEGLLTIRSMKGGEEIIRVVLLSPRIMELLPREKAGRIFPRWLTPEGEVDQVKLRWHWGKTRRKAKLSREAGQPPATFYQGRHTFARRYLEAGGDLRDLKEAMGHATMRMIDEVYGHIRSSVVQARMRAAHHLAGQWRGKIALSAVNPGQTGAHPITEDADAKIGEVVEKSAGI